MLIAEHFVLLALEPDSGLLRWPRPGHGADRLIAAALLFELATLRRAVPRGGLLSAEPGLPLSHPLLDAVLHALAPAPLTAADTLAQTERRLAALAPKILDSLFHRDILHRTSRGLLQRSPAAYPLRSVQARNEAIAHLRRAARTPNDMPGLALLMLADFSGLLPAHLQAREHETATQQLLALNRIDAQVDATRWVFAAVRAVLLG